MLLTVSTTYLSFLPDSFAYLAHLLIWGGLVFGLQWAVGYKILRRHLKLIGKVTFLLGTYLIATDVVAVYYGVWFFDRDLILGINPLGVPIEEWLFFYLTTALVAQTLILFLPDRLRLPTNKVKSAE